MTANELGFVHRFIPAQSADQHSTLLLLHGTGGDENDLLDLGRILAPGAAMLSPRGNVLESGLPRFFRRFAEGVFDVEDLIARTHELAAFIQKAAETYHFDPQKVIAVGYSNGANIATSTLLLHPDTLADAVLFRPMVPLEPDDKPDLSSKQIFISAGRYDAIMPSIETERLVNLLQTAGANVTLRWAARHTCLESR